MGKNIDKIILLLCLIAATVCGANLWNLYVEDCQRGESLGKIKNSVLKNEKKGEKFDINWDELYAQNPDIVGWVYVPEAGINYPVVQNISNNEFYLNNNFYGAPDEQGCPFLDNMAEPDFSADNNIIYAHSLPFSGMFTYIRNYKEASWFDSHPVFYLMTPQAQYQVDVLAYVNTSYNIDFYNTYFAQPDIVVQDLLQRASYINDSVDWTGGKFVSLSTCDLDYGYHSDMRNLLTGVMTEVDEIIYEG